MHSADFEAFLAEAMPIVESFEFDLPVGVDVRARRGSLA